MGMLDMGRAFAAVQSMRLPSDDWIAEVRDEGRRVVFGGLRLRAAGWGVGSGAGR
ncbi:hypothetical protein GCM10007933_11480 [Zoogloea oryzae]|uniref:Uncharacterized protein n=1 Tax=Zoogloea oryzae TaxID=310767 RepID=A0ABQ6F8X2_9RHOO|nr:hypothetical protein GCM10007933_11480 [Zoogloea oryzae]